jgi:DNA polymerase-3 subunit delta
LGFGSNTKLTKNGQTLRIALCSSKRWISDMGEFQLRRDSPGVVNGPIQALSQAMTPPFGLGQRLVWLQDTALGQRCPEEVLVELERTLPVLPTTTVLLPSSPNKPMVSNTYSIKTVQKSYVLLPHSAPIIPLSRGQ